MSTVIQAADACGTHVGSHAQAMRRADAVAIESALIESRARLLALFKGFETALGPNGLQIAYDPALNLPLWELGHIGWFEEWWIARNGNRARGIAYDEALARKPSLLAEADSFYDSSNVPHLRRWELALPNPDATVTFLAAVRESTIALLRQSGPTDDDLYFFRLVLFHEAMHQEAWFMMAQQLGIDLGLEPPDAPLQHAPAASEWHVPGGRRRIGTNGPGFAFDNEIDAHDVPVEAFTIDRAAVNWERFLPFVEAGGYDNESLWTSAGWDWRRNHSNGLPLHLKRNDGRWLQCRFGAWQQIDPTAPAIHLSAHEAQAWCNWGGRRLPTEAEWESAALLAEQEGGAFGWGSVWEWTASRFAPYPDFTPHPYRDYSAPFFDGRPVLRGGSFATAAIMRHPRYRNYFLAERNDVFAGFRSCAKT